jgi:hypothetical protein
LPEILSLWTSYQPRITDRRKPENAAQLQA